MITEWVKEVATHPGDGQAHAQHHRHHRRRRAPRARAGPTRSRSSTPSTRSWASTSTRFAPQPQVARPARRTAATAARRSSRSRCTWCRPSPATRTSGCRSRGIGGIATWQDAAEFMLLGADQRAGLHRRHALRLPHRRGHDRRAVELDATRRASRPLGDFAAEPCRASRTGATSTSTTRSSREIDQQKCIGCEPLLRRLRGRRAPVDRGGRRPEGAARSSRRSASAATSACSSARCRAASPWTRSPTGRAPMSWRPYQEALGKGVACELPGERHPH